MIRLPPRSTQSRSSAASDVYKIQELERLNKQRMNLVYNLKGLVKTAISNESFNKALLPYGLITNVKSFIKEKLPQKAIKTFRSVSYTHLRAHETPEHLVCRLLLEKKKKKTTKHNIHILTTKSIKQHTENNKETSIPKQNRH